MNPLRTTDSIADALAQAAKNWLAPDSKWRARAVAEAPGPTGFSPEMVNEAVTLTFGALTREALSKFIAPANAPRRITHILSGNVPAPGIGSICRGLLLNAVNLVKCSHRDPVFPTLFVESLREVDTELASRVTAVHWPREDTGRTQAALANAEAVIAYGDDDSIASLRALTPAAAQFFSYGHKVSFAIVGREALPDGDLPVLAAFDASVYDQQGCMSPHAFFVEGNAREFAAALAAAMATYETRVPRGRLSVEEAALAAQVRAIYEFRSANDRRVAIWNSKPPHPWTVIYDENPSFTPSCLNRTVFVKPLCTLDAMQALAGKVSTVGVAPWNDRLRSLSGKLPERVCPIGQMQRPPLSFIG
ncbi:MAG: acyl-CoA reductase [Verrucomicrobiota bacterium]